LAVLDVFLLTSVQVWEKKSDLKDDKIVDTVTLNCCVIRCSHFGFFFSIIPQTLVDKVFTSF
jgi:hypothetical protein